MADHLRLDFPDGIAPRNLSDRGAGWNWLSLVVLGAVMIAALLGAFGGGKSQPVANASAAARLEVTTPTTIRNGEFFEMRVRIEARRPIGKAVLVVPAALWRDMTVNSMLPGPAEEKVEDGAYRFDYGTMSPGDVLDIKFDGQINPPLFAGTRGTVELHDDAQPIAAIPLRIRVLP